MPNDKLFCVDVPKLGTLQRMQIWGLMCLRARLTGALGEKACALQV